MQGDPKRMAVGTRASRIFAWVRRALLALVVLVLVSAVAAVILLPRLLPKELLRKQVEEALAKETGRPVTIDAVGWSWTGGLACEGLKIGVRKDSAVEAAPTIAADGAGPEAPGSDAEGAPPYLARAERLIVVLGPFDLVDAAMGHEVALESLRIEGLRLWLVQHRDGSWNAQDLAGRKPVAIRSLQITDAAVHIRNEALGRDLDLTGVRATLRRLASTGQGILTMSTELPSGEAEGAGGPRGTMSMTASLSSLDPADRDNLSGSVNAEWRDVSWPEVMSVAMAVPPAAEKFSRTSGRVTATFERGGWRADGAIETDRLPLAGPETEAGAQPMRAVLGFQVSRASPRKPLAVDMVRLTAPGISLTATGMVRIEGPKDLAPDIHLVGRISWTPLCQNIAQVRTFADRFDRFGGETGLDLVLKTVHDGFHVTAVVDLKDTLAAMEPGLRKEPGQPCLLVAEATLPADLGTPRLDRLDVSTAAGVLKVVGPVPLGPVEAWPAGTSVVVSADLQSAEALAEMVPALGEALGPPAAADGSGHAGARISGPARAEVTVSPVRGGATPAWDARLRVSLTDLAIRAPSGPNKAAGTHAEILASATVCAAPGQGTTADVHDVTVRLGEGMIGWSGTASLVVPAEKSASPSGRTDGRVSIQGLEALGAILATKWFPADGPPPVAGRLSLAVGGELAGGKVTGKLLLDLTETAIAGDPYFVKPRGRPATAAVEGSLVPGEPHFLDSTTTLDLEGVHAEVTSRLQLHVAMGKPGDEMKARSLLIQSGPLVNVKLQAAVEDLGGLSKLSPAAGKLLQGKAHGPARVWMQVLMVTDKASFSGGADLTDAALALGGALEKTAGVPLHLSASADVAPAPASEQEPGFTCETSLDAALADSTTKVAGRIAAAVPRSIEAFASLDQTMALLRSADMKLDATWQHGPALEKALPWLRPLYAQCRIEGPLAVTARMAGTPLEGAVRLDLDAAACSIGQGGRILKKAGMPASLHLEARYGQVPGELILDGLKMRVADVEAEASGRFLFDDPRLAAAAPPAAWSVTAKGRLPDLAMLGVALPPEVRPADLAGGLEFDVQAVGDQLGTGLEKCSLVFQGAGLEWVGRRVLINGPVTYDGHIVSFGKSGASDPLHLVIGGTDLRLIGDIVRPEAAPAGAIFVRGPKVDVDELKKFAEDSQKRIEALARKGESGRRPRPAAPAATDPMAGPLGDLVRRARVSVDADIDQINVTVPEWDNSYFELMGFTAKARLAGGVFAAPDIRYGVNNGTVQSSVEIDLRGDVPVLAMTEDRRNLDSRDNIKPQIDALFPRLVCTGKVSTFETKRVRMETGAIPVGHGENTLIEGTLSGPSAPEYMQKLFPGLKLTTYAYKKMSNVYELQADGTIQNRMIFDGRDYDIYLFGYTKADGSFEYTLGIDLSVSLGSETWSRELDQGKVPLLVYTGRIVGKQFAEQYIRYVRPDELAYDVFIKRSLLIKLFQRLGKKPPDLSQPPK